MWLALVSALGVVGLDIESRLHRSELIIPGSPSQKATELVNSHFGESFDTVVLLEGPRAAINHQGPLLAAELERIPRVSVLTPWMIGTKRALEPGDDKALLIVRAFGSFDHVSKQVISEVREISSHAIRGPLRSHVTGYADVSQGIEGGTVAAIEQAEIIAAPFLIAILLLIFRSPIAAGLPLFVGFTTIAAARGVLALVNHIYPLDALTLGVASMMGLALGVDYALLMVSRFREEIQPTLTLGEATVTAAQKAGHTIVSAGVALVVCMTTAAFVVPGNLLVGVGIGLITAVVLSVLAALTALPASLALIGANIDRWRLGAVRTGKSRAGSLALRVLRRPALASFIVLLLALALSAPALSLNTGPPDPRGLPPNSVEYKDYAAVKRALGGGWVAPYEIDISAKHGAIAELGPLLAIYRFERMLAAHRDVDTVLGPGQILQSEPFALLAPLSASLSHSASFVLNLDHGGTAARIIVIAYGNPQKAGDPLRKVLEKQIVPLSRATGATVRLGGVATGLQDFDHATSNRLPLLAAWLALVTYIVLVGVLRSLLLPLLAVAFNVLTVGAAFGVLAICFQGAHPLLGGAGFVDAITAFGVYGIMFGLSIDYEVFLLTRMREGYAKTGSTEKAIGYGVERTAGVITGAALIMAVVFVAFATGDISPSRQLGVALTFAVLFDATLVRLVLLPSAMQLCGTTIWWFPTPLRRLVGLSWAERMTATSSATKSDPGSL